MTAVPERLARAKAYLAIAESKDAQREAYKRAAKELAAHKQESRDSNLAIAVALGRGEQGRDWVGRLLRWHDSGFKDETPFSAGGLNRQRSAVSDAKKVLKDPELREKVLRELTPSELTDLTEDAIQTHPATSVKGPRDSRSSKPTYGFTMEMMRPHARLRDAVNLYVETWEAHASEASEEVLQIERDLIAPLVLKLRMTVEEVSIA